MTRVGIIADAVSAGNRIIDGGAERNTYRLAKVSLDAGVQVTIYQAGSNFREFEVAGVPFKTLPCGPRRIWAEATRQALRDGCERLHYHYLDHVPSIAKGHYATATHHGVYWDIPYDRRIAAWYPYGNLAGLYLALWRRREKHRTLRAIGRCRQVLAADSSLLRIVQSDIPRLRRRIWVIRNFSDIDTEVDTDSELPAVPELRDAKEAGRLVVLVPRNLSLTKGVAWLADLCRIVTEQTAGICQFVVTGDFVRRLAQSRRYEANLRTSMGRLPQEAQSRITFLHGVEHKAMKPLYLAAHVVVIPTFAFEATSIAAIEAMTLGKPVIATNIGGLNDVIDDGFTGLLVQPTVEQIAGAVVRLVNDTALAERLGAEARHKAVNCFSLDAWSAAVVSFARSNGWLASGAAECN